MAPTDEHLLDAAQRGDAGAMNQLLTRHEPRIYRFGLRLCGEEQAALEVLQNTLVAAFRNLPEFHGRASLSTWLFQIARSFCMRERRPAWAAARTVPVDAPEVRALEAGAPSPDAVAHARRMGELLQAEIQALPSAEREALVLRDVEGLSAEEAAAAARIEVGALKSRLHRARRHLRHRLTAALGPDATAEAAR